MSVIDVTHAKKNGRDTEMRLTPEQLAEWKALVPKLNDDSNDHMGVAHSADMPPEHTVNYRHARNAEEAAFAITNLIAELREAQRRISISEAFAKELSSELITTRKQLAEAQAPHINSAHSYVQEVPDHCDRITWRGRYFHLHGINSIVALDAAIVEAVEPYRKQLAEAQALLKRLSPLMINAGYVGANAEIQRSLRDVRIDLVRLDTPALDAAIADAIEPYRKDAERLDWLEQQGHAYGFHGMHEGNRWVVEGPFATLRQLADAAKVETNEPLPSCQ
jgi:hypothetical protein